MLGRPRGPPPTSVLVAPPAPSRMSQHEHGSNERRAMRITHGLGRVFCKSCLSSSPFILPVSRLQKGSPMRFPDAVRYLAASEKDCACPPRRPRALRKGLPRRGRAPGSAVPCCTVDVRTNHARRNGQLRVRRPSVWRHGACSSAATTVLCPPLSLRGRYCRADGITCSRPIPYQNAVWPRQVAVTAVCMHPSPKSSNCH